MKERVSIGLVSKANEGWWKPHEKNNAEGHSREVYLNTVFFS